MADLSPDDREARRKALEQIAERRKEQLAGERQRREQREREADTTVRRQQEAQVRQEAQAAESLEARQEFIVKKREEKAQRERERLARLAEEQRLREEQERKEKEQEARMEYMGELHEKALRKKIANRREIIAHEEETSLREIADSEHVSLSEIEQREQRKIEHLEREAKRAALEAVMQRDKAKALAGDKRTTELARLKQETHDRETQARRTPEPARSQDMQNARREAAAKKLQIDRDYKVACEQADRAFAESEHDRALELQKQIAQAKAEAETSRAREAGRAEERRNQAHVRRVGEEQWLLGRE